MGKDNQIPHPLVDSFAGNGVAILVSKLVKEVPAAYKRMANLNLPVILAACLNHQQIGEKYNCRWFLDKVAYALATAEGESGFGRFMVELWGPTEFQKKYEGHKGLGNTEPGDGFKFRGRGFCQLTGRTNYKKWSEMLGVDLVNDPDLLTNPELAAKVMIIGMRDGLFTGVRLSRYVSESMVDYYNSRRVINGTFRAEQFAQSAVRYRRVLYEHFGTSILIEAITEKTSPR